VGIVGRTKACTNDPASAQNSLVLKGPTEVNRVSSSKCCSPRGVQHSPDRLRVGFCREEVVRDDWSSMVVFIVTYHSGSADVAVGG